MAHACNHSILEAKVRGWQWAWSQHQLHSWLGLQCGVVSNKTKELDGQKHYKEKRSGNHRPTHFSLCMRSYWGWWVEWPAPGKGWRMPSSSDTPEMPSDLVTLLWFFKKLAFRLGVWWDDTTGIFIQPPLLTFETMFTKLIFKLAFPCLRLLRHKTYELKTLHKTNIHIS